MALGPTVRQGAFHVPAGLPELIGQVASEVAVGVTIGFLATLLFSAIQMAGAFVDTQMGFGIINVLNPFSDFQNSALGQFTYQLGMTLFLMVGGPLILLDTLCTSYVLVAPGAVGFQPEVAQAFAGVVGQMVLLAFRIAAPAAAVLLVVDMAFAIVARTVPQMNVFLVSLPVKVVVGLLTVSLSLPILLGVAEQMGPATRAGATAVFAASR